ncbi:ribosome biogenesis protein NOP53-like [Branchiostoma lanceolatum]|uniref:ribosome biogenesis protein NOP53-like n=1 Tax=Branchiostoma lanceolatum TaxID=7740 RepID=UPI003454E8D6
MAATKSSDSSEAPQTSGSLFPQPKVRGKKKRVSKKNKSAWRKHSDIKDIEDFLDDQRLQLRTGGLVADKADDSLFYVDKQNDNEDEAPMAKKRKKELKPLKIDQIIAGETTVKPVTGHAPPMGSGKVRRKEMKARELEQKTGYISKEKRKKLKLNSVQTGLKKPQAVKEYYDLWGSDTKDKPTEEEEDEYYAQVTGKTRVKVPVRTQTYAKNPSILPKVEVIHPGGSYNPTFEDHQQLLQQAVQSERKKVKDEKKLERQTRLPPKREWATRRDKMKELTEGLLDEEDDEEEEGEEQEGEQSIPKATIRAEDKKSRQKRRKEKEQREQEQQKTADKTKKIKEHEVNRLKAIKKEINALEKKKEERQKKREEIRTQNADKPKRLSRHKYEEPFPEFKLSEELVGTLREFKPEGSVLKDRFKSLQRRNILETRVKAKRQKKFKKKYVEKKQYKEISINV